ncbi:transketolase [Bacillus sp. JJ722]|uniref:transketolase n=1 Tax=Bacillus sp. JJ722 TaxID=3122973 RepID=UPI002FFE30FE
MNIQMNELEQFRDEMRLLTLKELYKRGFGHYGGSLSVIETLTILYGEVMKVDPANPTWEDRDFLVLSKGHAGPALYAALALKGFFPEEMLYTLNNNGTHLPSHPDRTLTPGIDMTTGSLGQGISVATGVALSHKLTGKSNYTYSIVGDGELNEGQCWEAFQFAAHHKLNNLIVFIDDNKKQLDGLTTDIINPFDFAEKMKAFGFFTMRVDGSSLEEIYEAILRGKSQTEQPVAIVLDTIKGQGVPYIEQMESNHHIRPTQADEEAIMQAIIDLEAKTGKVAQ